MSSKDFAFTSCSIVSDTADMRIAIVVAEWNEKITQALLKRTIESLQENGIKESNITVHAVPGSFELIFGCSELVRHGLVDTVIAIGCVIRGDTPHFDYICQGVTQEIAALNRTSSIPIVYGLITVNDYEQALDRVGRKYDKGEEFAKTAIKMVDFSWRLKK